MVSLDKRDKPLKRGQVDARGSARERRLDAVLSRGGLAESADALLTLPAGERERGATNIAARLADEHERLLRAHEFAPLLAWRTRCEREPRLLPANDGVRVRWCWLIAAIRTRSWSCAQAIFLELEPALLGWSQRATLSSLVMHEGRLEPNALAALVSESLRLGYELPAKRTAHPCPTRVEDVEAACLSCFAQEPWPRFRAVVNEWLAQVPGEVARAILPLAVALSRRELAVQLARDQAAALEIARCCALWCLQAECPPAMEPVISLCVRLAARALPGRLAERPIVEACVPVIQASLGYPSLVEAVTQVVLAPLYAYEVASLGSRVEPRASALGKRTETRASAAAELLRALVGHVHSPRAMLKLAVVVAAKDKLGHKPVAAPPWLVRGFERALESPASLSEVLCEPGLHDAALYLFVALPLGACVQACITLFPYADELTRELLAQAAEAAARRMHEKQVARGALKVGPRDHAAPVPKSWRCELERLASPLLPYSLGLLEELLVLSQDVAEERALATRFWSRRARLSARFDALSLANERNYTRSVAVLQRELLCDYRAEAADAAQALLRAERCDAPRSVRKKIADVLLSALPEPAALAVEPRLVEAVRAARRLSKPVTPVASKRKRTPRAAKLKPRSGTNKRAAGERQAASLR